MLQENDSLIITESLLRFDEIKILDQSLINIIKLKEKRKRLLKIFKSFKNLSVQFETN